MSIQLISLDDLKTFLEQDGTGFDTLFNQIIPHVSSQIETFLNRKLKEEARVDYFSGGRRYYYLPAYPINPSPAPIIEEDDSVQTADSDYYIFEDEGLIEFTYETMKYRPKIIKISWTGGYAEAAGVLAVPDDIKQACIQQCAYAFKRRRDLGSSGVNTPDGNINYVKAIDLLPNVKNSLLPHRKIGDRR